MRRCPLLSPLFPYTTLFRSRCDNWRRRQMAYPICPERSLPSQSDTSQPLCTLAPQPLTLDFAPSRLFLVPRKYFTLAEANRDRKSTRLNSSHTVISYAVFCL